MTRYSVINLCMLEINLWFMSYLTEPFSRNDVPGKQHFGLESVKLSSNGYFSKLAGELYVNIRRF